MLLSLLLTACTAQSTLGSDMLARMDDVRTEVASHRSAVDAAASMDDVAPLESDHHDAMVAMMDDMSGMMADMMGCGIDSMMMDSMTDADGHMGEMTDEVDAHEQAHAEHVDMQGCMDEEDTYSQAMTDHLDTMAMDMGDFDGGAQCSASGGGGMM